MPLIAEVAVSNTAYSFDMLFSYGVPESMASELKPGCRVLIPFGRQDKPRTGIVMKTSVGEISCLKTVSELIDSEPALSEELLKLAVYVRENTFCTYFEAVKAMLPPAMSISVSEKYELSDNFCGYDGLSPDAARLLDALRAVEKSRDFNEICKSAASSGGRKLLNELCACGALISDNVLRQAAGDASVRMIRLSDRYIADSSGFKLTPKQKKAADFLAECGCASLKETAYMCGITAAVLTRLVASGAAEEYDAEVLRAVEGETDEKRRIDDVILSEEQEAVRGEVLSVLRQRRPKVFLLQGVTGSGKTSVFERLIADTIEMGRSALLMIPEIGLTPQILRRFRALFGDEVAVIHSGLTLGQRLDEYKRIKRGDAKIVIGTRSAVFAPLENIGLIVMDEEGERTYKSESAPRYSACDIAKQRCAHHGAVLLLASATPSIESRYLAEKGSYSLLRLTKRYSSNPLPEVEIIDMNEERQSGNRSEFSRRLKEEIDRNLRCGEQTILLLNRRGYHTIISCCDCFRPVYCPNCSVPMTYHKANGMMMCHYCGCVSEPVKICPSCGSDRLKSMGFGTQRLEEELEMFFPSARILRMDADTAFSRYSYEKNFNAFRRGDYDIMIGTQMIGKGLDFPKVTLVGVLSVDKALYAGDFRSYERTFSLITQVVGRSGRGSASGRALLQTFIPDHYVMNLAAQQDYDAFYREEIAIRRAMVFPPICDMCVFCFSGIDEESVKNGSYAVLGLMNVRLRELCPKTPVRVLGPVKCSYGRINGKFRYRIIMKCKNNSEMRGFISEILVAGAGLPEMKRVSLYADMNGDTGV